jgi:hypothetical protein
MNIPDLIFEFFLLILKVFDADPVSCQTWIRDGKNSDPGSGKNFPDLRHCLWEQIKQTFLVVTQNRACWDWPKFVKELLKPPCLT